MEKKQNVPALRFQGFSGEWEKTTVGKIFEVTRGETLAAPKTSPTQNPVMNYPVYSSQTKNNGLMGYYSEYLFENAITWTTDGANAGTVRFRKGKFYCTNVCGVLLSKQGYANTFMAEALNKVAWKHVSKVGNPKLMNNVMKEISIHAPKTIDEQNELAEYIEKLDLNIFNRMQKIRKLQQFRQAMLTKLFPWEGAAEPELRFRGFSGKWKSCCLTDIATINPPGELPETFNYVDLESVIGTEIVKYRRETKFSAPSRAQRVAEDNDVFYQMVRPYQKNNCIFRGNDKTFVFSTGYAQLRPNCNSYFLLSLLQTEYFVGKVMELCTGTSFPAISASDLSRIPIYVPVMSEENGAIGEYFQNLDSYISLQQKKLERMQRLKAALLEKLFV